METERPDRQSRPIVAFDFDGTLTIRDSYTSFLKWRNGPLAYGLGRTLWRCGTGGAKRAPGA